MRILCYGDSNTWGFVPGKANYKTMYMERYSSSMRWTGRLQAALGSQDCVIEEGLNGRTTNLDMPDEPWRNGRTYLPACIHSHAPLDLVILCLGTNDLKTIFDRTPEQIGAGLTELVEIILNSKVGPDMQSSPQVLLVSPSALGHELYRDKNGVAIFTGGQEKSRALSKVYQGIAKQYGCDFVDMAPHITVSGIDGLHLDESGHQVFADVLLQTIRV